MTQTFPDMEEHSGKKSGRRAIIWLYNNKVVFLYINRQTMVEWFKEQWNNIRLKTQHRFKL